MSKNKLFLAIYILCVIVVLFNSFFFIKDEFFYDMNCLPQGKFVFSSLSPNGDRSVLLYSVESPKGNAVRVELVNFDTDMSVKEQKNIYWETGKSSLTIGWEDNNRVIIDTVLLDISKNEVYDCRNY